MGTEITLQDNCRIIYVTMPVKLRSYRFEYTTFNDIKNDATYDIYLKHVDFKDKFCVKGFMKDDIYFDTLEDAKTYIFKEFNDLRFRLNHEQEQIKAYWNQLNDKKRRKKDGNKVN